MSRKTKVYLQFAFLKIQNNYSENKAQVFIVEQMYSKSN
jgi:hypothetical protein